ncbi:hypothetical protein ZBT109_2342 [Zymobacter palmae]|uniref:Uncharacterized protein n=1 Tax=Zymobacter palmae TaxID=33074 RepID=A0A348HHH2_9GAMM|nr:hypothetical protein ZBT109_2342 [Zymobacter palmae]
MALCIDTFSPAFVAGAFCRFGRLLSARAGAFSCHDALPPACR